MTTYNPLRHCTDTGVIAGRLDEVADSAVDLVAPAGAFMSRSTEADSHGMLVIPREHGVPQHDGVHFELPVVFTRTGFRQLVERLDIPLRYADLLVEQQPALFDVNVDARAAHVNSLTLFRLLRTGDVWQCRAVLSNQYQAIDNLDILIATIHGASAAGVEIQSCHVEADWTDDRFRLRIAVPQVEVAAAELFGDYKSPFGGPGGFGEGDWSRHNAAFQRQLRDEGRQVGDVIWAGLEVSNSETGGGAATVGPRALVLACLNGLTRKTDILRQVHLGGRLEEGPVVWSAETNRKVVELIEARMTDAVRLYCSEGYLEGLIAEMQRAKGVEVADPVATFEVVQARLGFTEEEHDAALNMFVRSGDMSVLGVGQAVTAMAQTVEDSDRQSEIEQMFWELVGNPDVYAHATVGA